VDFYVLFLFLFILIALILKYSKSLKFVDNFLHQHFYSLACFTTNFSVYSISLAGSISQICIYFFVVHFVANYVNWACSIVIFYLSQPIVHAVHWCFVGKIYKNHDEMWLFIHLVSYLKEVQSSTHVPESHMHLLALQIEILIDWVTSKSRLVIVGTATG